MVERRRKVRTPEPGIDTVPEIKIVSPRRKRSVPRGTPTPGIDVAPVIPVPPPVHRRQPDFRETPQPEVGPWDRWEDLSWEEREEYLWPPYPSYVEYLKQRVVSPPSRVPEAEIPYHQRTELRGDVELQIPKPPPAKAREYVGPPVSGPDRYPSIPFPDPTEKLWQNWAKVFNIPVPRETKADVLPLPTPQHSQEQFGFEESRREATAAQSLVNIIRSFQQSLRDRRRSEQETEEQKENLSRQVRSLNSLLTIISEAGAGDVTTEEFKRKFFS